MTTTRLPTTSTGRPSPSSRRSRSQGSGRSRKLGVGLILSMLAALGFVVHAKFNNANADTPTDPFQMLVRGQTPAAGEARRPAAPVQGEEKSPLHWSASPVPGANKAPRRAASSGIQLMDYSETESQVEQAVGTQDPFAQHPQSSPSAAPMPRMPVPSPLPADASARLAVDPFASVGGNASPAPHRLPGISSDPHAPAHEPPGRRLVQPVAGVEGQYEQTTPLFDLGPATGLPPSASPPRQAERSHGMEILDDDVQMNRLPQALPLRAHESPQFGGQGQSVPPQREPAPFFQGESAPLQIIEEPASPPAFRQAAQTVSAFQPTPVEEPEDEVYEVQPGDNYWTISRKFYGAARYFAALAEYNKHRIPKPERMKPGMIVLVPSLDVLQQAHPEMTGANQPSASAPERRAGFFIDQAGQPAYRVGEGDTLTDIAERHLGRSSRWVQIQGMNRDRIQDGNALTLGTELRLPADASQVSSVPLN